jgi:NAD-dependent DNA ligase
MQIPREEVAEYATGCGYFVRGSVSRKTDYLVVGTENVSPSKVAKVNLLNDEGCDIKIITENTFLELISDDMREF